MLAPRLSRTILWALFATLALTGGWALGAPHWFYDSFPGAGHTWVALLPSYNEHLVRDVGALSLSLAVLVAAAALTLQRLLVTVAALATLIWSTPHLLFHLGHLDGLGTADKVGQVVVLVLGVAAPLALLGLTAAAGREAGAARSP
jgi:hypothetical protein